MQSINQVNAQSIYTYISNDFQHRRCSKQTRLLSRIHPVHPVQSIQSTYSFLTVQGSSGQFQTVPTYLPTYQPTPSCNSVLCGCKVAKLQNCKTKIMQPRHGNLWKKYFRLTSASVLSQLTQMQKISFFSFFFNGPPVLQLLYIVTLIRNNIQNISSCDPHVHS